MTANEVRSEINRFALGLLRTGLAAAVNLPVLVGQDSGVRVTWPAGANASLGFFSELQFASLTEYRQFVLESQFIALLTDASLLQISVDVRGETVTGHRFCYYPCPVILPAGFDVLDFDLLDLYLIEELDEHARAIGDRRTRFSEQLRLRSPLRFDYAPEARTASEPASHLHVLNGDTRIAVHGPLCIGDFVQFVFKNFYPRIWEDESLSSTIRWPIRSGDRTITASEEIGLYLNCRRQLAAGEPQEQ